MICGQDLDRTQNIMELVKQHTVKDALYMLADTWEEGSTDSICKAYKLQIHPEVWTNVSEPELEHISMMLKTDLMSKMSSQLHHNHPMNKF